MKKVFCWDFDGTLSSTEHVFAKSMCFAFQEQTSLPSPSLAEMLTHSSRGFTWHNPQAAYPERTGDLWWSDTETYLRSVFLSLGLDDVHSAKAARRVRELVPQSTNYTLYPDAIAALEACKRAGHINILLSNNYPDLPLVIKGLGLSPLFEHLVVSSLIGYEKPHQGIFKAAMQSVPDAEQFFMIGDYVDADIVGGHQAGMTTVLVHTPCHPLADHCFNELLPIALL